MASVTINLPNCPKCNASFFTEVMCKSLTNVPFWYLDNGGIPVPHVFSCPSCMEEFEFTAILSPVKKGG